MSVSAQRVSVNVNQQFENFKQHTRHPKLSIEIEFGQINSLVPEKSESEIFTQKRFI